MNNAEELDAIEDAAITPIFSDKATCPICFSSAWASEFSVKDWNYCSASCAMVAEYYYEKLR